MSGKEKKISCGPSLYFFNFTVGKKKVILFCLIIFGSLGCLLFDDYCEKKKQKKAESQLSF